MSDYIYFEGRIEPMEWGKNVYTIQRIPTHVMADLPEGTRRIEGEFGDHPVNLALTKAPVIEGSFVYTGKTFLRDSGLDVGKAFDARVRAADPDEVEVPEDLLAALRSAEKSDVWQSLTPGRQRGLLHGINTAKRAETRLNRISKLVASL